MPDSRRRGRRCLPALFAGLLLTGTVARAERLLAPGTGASPAAAGAAAVVLDREVARGLVRIRRAAVLEQVPLPGGRAGDFHVAPVEVLAPGARVVAFDGRTAQTLPPPDVVVYEGEDAADPARRIVLAIGGDGRVWGLVREEATAVAAIHPLAAAGEAGAHALVDAGAVPAAGPGCENHVGDAVALRPHAGRSRRAAPAVVVPGPLLAASVLVDVDYDLYAGAFGSSATEATAYATAVFGAASSLYRRDLNLVPLIGELVVWTAPDPFTGSATSAQLQSYRGWHFDNRIGQPRALAHLLGALPLGGGRAYLDVLCDPSFGYGVSNLHGTATAFPNTGYLWDVNVIAHELGHGFGAEHTHCYVPPVDRCYNQEAGCYGGAVVPSTGETMSYCHLVERVEMGFGGVVGGAIRAGAAAATCLADAPGTCGDGAVDPGEQCDDGNGADGDCCAATCTFEGGSTPCADDGDRCTSDLCRSGECVHLPPGECSVCETRVVVPAEGGTFAGTTWPGPGELLAPCGFSAEAAEQVFEWTPAASGTATLGTCHPGTTFDTVLFVRHGDCDGGADAACADDAGCTLGGASTLTLAVTAGETYHVVVDGYYGEHGDFVLEITPPVTCPAGTALVPEVCRDADACTVDGCGPAGCTTAPRDCDDADACTVDGCDPATGCTAVPIDCDDGDACTADGCDPATGCTAAAVACDDGEACTTDACDAATGCGSTPLRGATGARCQLDAMTRLVADAAAGTVHARTGVRLRRLLARATAAADALVAGATTKAERRLRGRLGRTVAAIGRLVRRQAGRGLAPDLATALGVRATEVARALS